MPIDVELARSITPGTRHVCHLNNAGSALTTQPVLDAMVGYLQREATIGGYEAEAEARPVIEAVYDSVATLLGAHRDEIALVESATAAWNAAFASIDFKPGDRVLTGRTEYVSNAINLLVAVERQGIEIVLIDDDENGQISLGDLRAAVDERTKLIALTHVATSGGLVNPAAAVGKIARQAGVLYLLDACQSAGQRPLNVDELGCDMLAATGRKFLRAPRGTGFLYVRGSALDALQPFQLDTRSATWTGPNTYEVDAGARRFEEFESSLATRVGLGVAVEYALSLGLEQIAARTSGLAAQLRDMLRAVPAVEVHDKGADVCGIVTFSVAGSAATDVKEALAQRSINTSITGPWFAQFDLPDRGLDQLVRASPHYYNTEDELAQLVDVVSALA
jgi:cysteine desulfurase / selenocysteine lyase